MVQNEPQRTALLRQVAEIVDKTDKNQLLRHSASDILLWTRCQRRLGKDMLTAASKELSEEAEKMCAKLRRKGKEREAQEVEEQTEQLARASTKGMECKPIAASLRAIADRLPDSMEEIVGKITRVAAMLIKGQASCDSAKGVEDELATWVSGNRRQITEQAGTQVFRLAVDLPREGAAPMFSFEVARPLVPAGA